MRTQSGGDGLELNEIRRRPDARCCGEQRSPLLTADAIRHRVREERIRQLVELRPAVRGTIRRVHERHYSVRCLLYGGLDEAAQRGDVAYFPMLPGGLESPRVGERSGRERGVD